MEAFARVELGLDAEEFNDLVPAQFQALCDALAKRKRESQVQTAVLVAAIYNSAGKVSKKTVTIEELMGEPAKELSEEEKLQEHLATMRSLSRG